MTFGLRYRASNGTWIEFVKREVYWEDGKLVTGPESPITPDDANLLLEEDAKAKGFDELRERVKHPRFEG